MQDNVGISPEVATTTQTMISVLAAPLDSMEHNVNRMLGTLPVESVLITKSMRIVALLIAIMVLLRVATILIDKYRRILLANPKLAIITQDTKRVETLTEIMRNALFVVISLLGLVMILSEVGINIAPLLAGAGIAGVAIGFGSQSLVKDLFYGFFILLENQFGIGDVVQIGTSTGKVERMTLRAITLRDAEGRVHIIPNGEATRVIVSTEGWSVLNVAVEISPQASLDHAFEVIEALNRQFFEQHLERMIEMPQLLGVDDFGPKGPILRITAKTQTQQHWELARRYRKALKEALDKADIPIMTV